MYSDQFWQMDPLAMQLLALEVLYQHGGFHVPLAVPWAKHSTLKALAGKELADRMLVPTMDPTVEDSCFSAASVNKGFVEADGLRIFGAAPGHVKLLSKIKDLIMLKPGALSARYIAPSDAVAAYLDFPTWTRFLGAEEIFDLCNSPASDRATLSWSYDSMVPSYALPREHRSALRGAPGRFVAITDAEVFHHRALTDAVPGFIQQMDGAHGEDGWDFVLLMLQWQVVSGPSSRRGLRFAVRATAVSKRLFPSPAGWAGRLCPLRAARLGAPQRLARCRDPGESRARRQAPAALRRGGQLGACRLHPTARRGRAQGSAPRRARARALRSKAKY